MKLVIFDLDQTLVEFITVHDKATLALFQKFFGVAARLTEIDFSGKSLNGNLRELAREKKVPEEVFLSKSGQLLAEYEKAFARSMPADASAYVLPGARELLEELSRTEHIVVLYTGDSPGIVKTVFRATGLGKYFRFALYGTEVTQRADMVRLAISRAAELTGRQFRQKDIVIIGDSLQDIACGKLFGAATIAVATGFHAAAQLAEAKPDFLFPDLKDYPRVKEAIEQTGK